MCCTLTCGRFHCLRCPAGARSCVCARKSRLPTTGMPAARADSSSTHPASLSTKLCAVPDLALREESCCWSCVLRGDAVFGGCMACSGLSVPPKKGAVSLLGVWYSESLSSDSLMSAIAVVRRVGRDGTCFAPDSPLSAAFDTTGDVFSFAGVVNAGTRRASGIQVHSSVESF